MVTSTRLERNEVIFRQNMARLLYKVMFLEGSKGKGKSVSHTAISYNLRELFGKSVLVVGTSLGLDRNKYGEFRYVQAEQFIEELKSFSELAGIEASKSHSAVAATDLSEDKVKRKLMSMGLVNSVLVMDEAQQIFDASHRDKLSRAFGYFLSAVRHYKDTVLISAPERQMIDRRIKRQVDYYVAVGNDCRTQFDEDGNPHCIRPGCMHIVTNTYFNPREAPWRQKWLAPVYWEMYDSWSTIAFRDSAMSVLPAAKE